MWRDETWMKRTQDLIYFQNKRSNDSYSHSVALSRLASFFLLTKMISLLDKYNVSSGTSLVDCGAEPNEVRPLDKANCQFDIEEALGNW